MSTLDATPNPSHDLDITSYFLISSLEVLHITHLHFIIKVSAQIVRTCFRLKVAPKNYSCCVGCELRNYLKRRERVRERREEILQDHTCFVY